MKQTTLLAAVILAGTWFGGPSLWAQPNGSDLTIEVTTDRSAYLLGDPVTVTVTKCNPTGEAITVPHNCICCHDQIYALDAAGNSVSEGISGCTLIIYALHLEPNECSSRDFEWQQLSPAFGSGMQVPAGAYTLFHTWIFPDFTAETESAEIILGGVVAIPTLGRLESAGLALFLAIAGTWFLARRGRRSMSPPGS